MCPDNVKIPRRLFEKLTKKYYQEEWAYKYDQIANCTVLTVDQNILREVRVHRQYLQAMKNIMMYSSTDPGKSMKHLLYGRGMCGIPKILWRKFSQVVQK